jgi:hypothetical protein
MAPLCCFTAAATISWSFWRSKEASCRAYPYLGGRGTDRHRMGDAPWRGAMDTNAATRRAERPKDNAKELIIFMIVVNECK